MRCSLLFALKEGGGFLIAGMKKALPMERFSASGAYFA